MKFQLSVCRHRGLQNKHVTRTLRNSGTRPRLDRDSLPDPAVHVSAVGILLATQDVRADSTVTCQ